jgi:hypothetical protein
MQGQGQGSAPGGAGAATLYGQMQGLGSYNPYANPGTFPYPGMPVANAGSMHALPGVDQPNSNPYAAQPAGAFSIPYPPPRGGPAPGARSTGMPPPMSEPGALGPPPPLDGIDNPMRANAALVASGLPLFCQPAGGAAQPAAYIPGAMGPKPTAKRKRQIIVGPDGQRITAKNMPRKPCRMSDCEEPATAR